MLSPLTTGWLGSDNGATLVDLPGQGGWVANQILSNRDYYCPILKRDDLSGEGDK